MGYKSGFAFSYFLPFPCFFLSCHGKIPQELEYSTSRSLFVYFSFFCFFWTKILVYNILCSDETGFSSRQRRVPGRFVFFNVRKVTRVLFLLLRLGGLFFFVSFSGADIYFIFCLSFFPYSFLCGLFLCSPFASKLVEKNQGMDHDNLHRGRTSYF
jgi:hypothetical protein